MARSRDFGPLGVILLFYALSLLIQFEFQGIDEIVKVVLSVGIAWFILKDIPVPASNKEYPKKEAIIGLLSFGALLAGAFLLFLYSSGLAGLISILIIYVIPIVFTIRHYDWEEWKLLLKDLGLSIPTIRAMASWVVTILVLYSLIVISSGDNLPIFLQGYADVIGLNDLHRMASLLIIAVIPEELFFRVYLQTRLERLMPIRWAILVQALLFNLAHVPQRLIRSGFLPFLAETLLVANGLIGGYFWHKTKNLPVLALYHLTIYPVLSLVFFPEGYLR